MERELDVAKASSPLIGPDQVSPKQQALDQLAKAASGDGTIFQQLASNPFFTAVRCGVDLPLSIC